VEPVGIAAAGLTERLRRAIVDLVAKPPYFFNHDARAATELAAADTRSRLDDDLAQAEYEERMEREAADAAAGRQPGPLERFKRWVLGALVLGALLT
jgi:hypothetical protein